MVLTRIACRLSESYHDSLKRRIGIRIGKSATKAASKLSREDYTRLIDALLMLCAAGLGDIKTLQGYEKGTLRLRVGQLRVYLVLTRFFIEVIGIEPRGEAYKTKSRAKLKKRAK